MKRYILFAGQNYYPRGGMRDYHSAHDTLSSATNAVEIEVTTDKGIGSLDWFNVFDCVEGMSMNVDLDNMTIRY